MRISASLVLVKMAVHATIESTDTYVCAEKDILARTVKEASAGNTFQSEAQ